MYIDVILIIVILIPLSRMHDSISSREHALCCLHLGSTARAAVVMLACTARARLVYSISAHTSVPTLLSILS